MFQATFCTQPGLLEETEPAPCCGRSSTVDPVFEQPTKSMDALGVPGRPGLKRSPQLGLDRNRVSGVTQWANAGRGSVTVSYSSHIGPSSLRRYMLKVARKRPLRASEYPVVISRASMTSEPPTLVCIPTMCSSSPLAGVAPYFLANPVG